jgi:hypothetical protein
MSRDLVRYKQASTSGGRKLLSLISIIASKGSSKGKRGIVAEDGKEQPELPPDKLTRWQLHHFPTNSNSGHFKPFPSAESL